MQVIINITEKEYERCQDLTTLDYNDVVDFLMRVEEVLDSENCMILPKDHNRLIDVDALISLIDKAQLEYPVSHFEGLETARLIIMDAPTITEKDGD